MNEELGKRVEGLEARINDIVFLRSGGSMDSHYWSHSSLTDQTESHRIQLHKLWDELEELRLTLLRLASEPEVHGLIK